MITKVLLQSTKVIKLIASSGPRFGTIFVNTDCNRRCAYCMVPQLGSSDVLSSEVWNQIIDRIVSWGVGLLNFLGGEPTLRKDLAEIIAHASKKVIVSLTSNGDTFVGPNGEERFRTLVSSGLSVLSLSLHNIDEVGRQLDILQMARRLGLLPLLGVVVTKQTIEELPDVMREANRRGVPFRYSLYQNVGGSFSSDTEDLIPTPSQLATFVATVQEQERKTHLIGNTEKYMIEGTKAYPNGWHCDSHRDNWIIVDNEGRLMACCEHPTPVPVLDIQTLKDDRWTEIRTAKREACKGCTYQCYMDEENSGRVDLAREAISTAWGLFQSRERIKDV